MLKVQFPRDIVQCSLAGTIGGAGERELIHIGHGGYGGGDGDELRSVGRFFEKREHGLEEDQGADGVDLEMDLDFLRGRDNASAPVVGDTGVGDDDVDVRDGLFGEGGDGGARVRGGERVDLHDNDLAAGTGNNGLDGGGLGCVADSCDDDAVGPLGVRGDKTETNT